MEKGKFQNSLDEALLAQAVLSRLGSGKIGTFSERFKSQKVQYFAQLFRVSPKYNYNLYIWGPYSRYLTSDLFQLKEGAFKTSRLDRFVSDEVEGRFQKLRDFLKGKNNRELELISTLHWLIKAGGLNSDMAIKKLIEIKGAEKKETSYALREVKKLYGN